LSTFTNPDGLSFGSSALEWVKNYAVYVNGILCINGFDAAANKDTYYVSSTSLAFEFRLVPNDTIQIIQTNT